MQRETSNDSFLDYGSVYHQPIDREHPELIHQTMVAITRRYVSQFYCFNCDTYLQVKERHRRTAGLPHGGGCRRGGVCDEQAHPHQAKYLLRRRFHDPEARVRPLRREQLLRCISQTFLPSTNFWPSCPASRYRKFWATTTASALRTTVSMVSGTISSS